MCVERKVISHPLFFKRLKSTREVTNNKFPLVDKNVCMSLFIENITVSLYYFDVWLGKRSFRERNRFEQESLEGRTTYETKIKRNVLNFSPFRCRRIYLKI